MAYVRYALENQAYYRVMFSDLQLCEKHPDLDRVSQQAFAVLLDAIKVGQNAQVFIPEDSLQLAHVCWSLTHGVSMLAIDRQLTISDSDDIIELARIATKTVSKGLIKENKSQI